MPHPPCIYASDSQDVTAIASASTVFLPTRTLAANIGDRVTAAIDTLSRAIAAQRDPQPAANCANGTRLTLREAGWGSTLSSLVKPRLWALLHGRTPLAAQPLQPARHGVAP